jgi:hypothetical protein
MEIAACLGKIVTWLILVDATIYFNIKIALVIVLILAALLTPLLRLIGPAK